MISFEKALEKAKRDATLHLLFKCARLLNERAVSSVELKGSPPGPRPRAAHLSLYAHIDLKHGTRLTDLSVKLGITKQAVGQLVDDLEEMGAVERFLDPDDGRAKRVVFTELGKAQMLSGLAHLKEVEAELRHEVGAHAMNELRRSLLVIHDALTEPASDTQR